jgi:hypothetical protein
VDGIQVADRELKPGRQQILAPGVAGSGDSVTVAIELDRTYSAAGDQRVLGAVLGGVGFRE